MILSEQDVEFEAVACNGKDRVVELHIVEPTAEYLNFTKEDLEGMLAKIRLEEIREELVGERISYGELCELQDLIPYIDENDVQLLEAAGVPENV